MWLCGFLRAAGRDGDVEKILGCLRKKWRVEENETQIYVQEPAQSRLDSFLAFLCTEMVQSDKQIIKSAITARMYDEVVLLLAHRFIKFSGDSK
jgi:hypothetical protein